MNNYVVVGAFRYLLTLSITLFIVLDSFGQQRCGTVPYNAMLKERFPFRETTQQFEQWIQKKRNNKNHTLGTERIHAVYEIPVVVHVIHNGEPIGMGVNISDEQIISQINVLNQDYQRTNADASNTLSEFLPVAAGFDLSFILAKQTPEGQPTNGIVRKQGPKTSWNRISDNYLLKSQSYWPAEDYLNLWVTDLGNFYLGYAQFPESDLEDLENSSTNSLTDGVVIDYQAFGTIDANPAFNLTTNYDKGRTATHEIGHFFGLRHIWGDDEGMGNYCLGTDYVDDTPNQSLATTGCPTGSQASCSVNKMYQNYLDYTNDGCMNLFTQGQIDRMTIILNNSPRRASLLTSAGLMDPNPVANDMGISNILAPSTTSCGSNITPQITLTNYGTNTVTSVNVRMLVNGSPVETFTESIDLDPLESTTSTFSLVSIPSGTTAFTFEILSTNGTADGNSSNNTSSLSTTLASTIPTPFAESFNAIPATWKITNPDGDIGWELVPAPNGTPGNTALRLNFFEYEAAEGEADLVYTPVFSLLDETSAYLSFEIAHAPFPGNTDGMHVYVLTNCNDDLYSADLIYNKVGSALGTTTPTTQYYTPTSHDDWRNEIIDLSDYVGQSQVQLAFVGFNGYGNNLYLDKIRVLNDSEEDLSIQEIIKPTGVHCSTVIAPELQIRNESGIQINSFMVTMNINGLFQDVPFNQPIGPGEIMEIILPETSLQAGENTLTFTVYEPNGLVDANPENNTLSITSQVKEAETYVPLRENFDNGLGENWTVINPAGGQNWEPINTNFNTSLVFNGYNNEEIGDESWLVSPILNFSYAQTASLFFDISYGVREPQYDYFRILGSIDCGITYPYIISATPVTELTSITASSFWQPQDADDWSQRIVNLNIFTGEPNARLAFVLTNGNGNNFYLDNLEFFNSNDADPKKIERPYLVYDTAPDDPHDFYITFNLEDQQQVYFEISDLLGRTLSSHYLPYVLNQTFQVEADNQAPGIYLLRLKIGNDFYAHKIYLKD